MIMDTCQEQKLDQLQYEIIETFNINQTIVTSIAISNDDKLLAFGSNRLGFPSHYYAIKIWRIQDKKIILQLKGPCSVFHAIFSHNNKILAAAGQKPYDIFVYNIIVNIRPYDIFVYNIQNTNQQLPISILRRDQSNIHRFIFTMDNQQLISCSQDEYLEMWNVVHSKKIAVKQLLSPITDIAISENGYVGVMQYNGNADILSKQLIRYCEWKAHWHKSFSIQFIQNSKIILTSGGYKIRFWVVSEMLQGKINSLRVINFQDSPELWVLRVYPPLNPQVLITYNGKIEWISLNSELSLLSIMIPGGLWIVLIVFQELNNSYFIQYSIYIRCKYYKFHHSLSKKNLSKSFKYYQLCIAYLLYFLSFNSYNMIYIYSRYF